MPQDEDQAYRPYPGTHGTPWCNLQQLLKHLGVCPIIHVKEILGHERLDTTCRYYLGIDKELAKRAHKEYLNF